MSESKDSNNGTTTNAKVNAELNNGVINITPTNSAVTNSTPTNTNTAVINTAVTSMVNPEIRSNSFADITPYGPESGILSLLDNKVGLNAVVDAVRLASPDSVRLASPDSVRLASLDTRPGTHGSINPSSVVDNGSEQLPALITRPRLTRTSGYYFGQ